ncbi:hypothetical protein K2X30_13510 [bacterium]|nr:hypothetical protein [bacterium]
MRLLALLALVLGFGSAAASAECVNSAYENIQAPENPDVLDLPFHYYGFSIKGICSAQDTDSVAEEAHFEAHPEGYYRIEMKSFIRTSKDPKSKVLETYEASYIRRSFEAAVDRELVEKTLLDAMSIGSVGVPVGLGKEIQEKFVKIVLPILKAQLEHKIRGEKAAAERRRLEAQARWFEVLAKNGNVSASSLTSSQAPAVPLPQPPSPVGRPETVRQFQ